MTAGPVETHAQPSVHIRSDFGSMSNRTPEDGGEKWATCSPRDFRGCDVYANRDAGLVAQGYREHGFDCRSILLGSPREDDLPSITRARRKQLECPGWWSENVNRGVVFYNAFKPSFSPVLVAAKEAGLRVGLNIDSTGILDFQTCPRDFWDRSLRHHSLKRAIPRIMCSVAAVAKSGMQTWRGAHRRLAAHLALADVIGGVTPPAVDRLRDFLWRNREEAAAERVHLIPHPIHSRFTFQGEKPSSDKVTFVTVGRWFDRPQKRPDLLIRTIDLLLAADPAFEFRVFGKLVPEIESWHASLVGSARQRVRLHGLAPNAELLEAFQTAHIYLCVSSYESFLIAGAEAMGCGCSLVACDSAALPGPSWFARDHRGTLSSGLRPGALRDAALFEARAWHDGQRDPAEISAWTANHMHAGRVAACYRRLLDSDRLPQGAAS